MSFAPVRRLIRNKKAGRPQDIADAARLEEGDR
jgi:hypothetical protein